MQLHAAIRRHGGNPGGKTRGEGGENDLGRRGPVVLGREHLGVIGFDHVRLPVRMLLPQSREVRDRRAAVGAVHPLATGPPLELGGLWCVGERLARSEYRLDVDAVVGNWCFGLRHLRFLFPFVRGLVLRRGTPSAARVAESWG